MTELTNDTPPPLRVFWQRAQERRLLDIEPPLPDGHHIAATPTITATTLTPGRASCTITGIALEAGDAPRVAQCFIATPDAAAAYRLDMTSTSSAGETIITSCIVKTP